MSTEKTMVVFWFHVSKDRDALSPDKKSARQAAILLGHMTFISLHFNITPGGWVLFQSTINKIDFSAATFGCTFITVSMFRDATNGKYKLSEHKSTRRLYHWRCDCCKRPEAAHLQRQEFERVWMCLQATNLNERVPNSQRGIQNVTLRTIGWFSSLFREVFL